MAKGTLYKAHREFLAKRRAEENGDDILAVPTEKRNSYRLEAKHQIVTLDKIIEYEIVHEAVVEEMSTTRRWRISIIMILDNATAKRCIGMDIGCRGTSFSKSSICARAQLTD